MTEKGLAAVIADLIADEYLRFTAEQVKLRSEAERLKVDVDELHEERFRLMAERDALRAEAQHLRDARAEAELAHIRERDSLVAIASSWLQAAIDDGIHADRARADLGKVEAVFVKAQSKR